MARKMVFFVDSADRAKAEVWLRSGVATGLTTNPTILKRAGATLSDVSKIAAWARRAGATEVCFQTWGASTAEWKENAYRLLDMDPEAVIKVPCTPRGAEVAYDLQAQGIPILMTAGYAAKQVLIASALGVRYFAPYFNRMDLEGRDALTEFARMTSVVPQEKEVLHIMAASIKSASDVMDLAQVGIHTFTLAPEILAELFVDDLTSRAVADFEEDMEAVLGGH